MQRTLRPSSWVPFIRRRANEAALSAAALRNGKGGDNLLAEDRLACAGREGRSRGREGSREEQVPARRGIIPRAHATEYRVGPSYFAALSFLRSSLRASFCSATASNGATNASIAASGSTPVRSSSSNAANALRCLDGASRK